MCEDKDENTDRIGDEVGNDEISQEKKKKKKKKKTNAARDEVRKKKREWRVFQEVFDAFECKEDIKTSFYNWNNAKNMFS